jgi:hypothetical protein
MPEFIYSARDQDGREISGKLLAENSDEVAQRVNQQGYFVVKINPATYGIAPIRQVILKAPPDSPFGISIFGHTMSLWDNIAVLATFGTAMILLAVWSFGNQE